MFESIINTIGTAKDRLVEASARSFINGKIEPFGSVTRLEIDSRQKKISAEVLLKGETSPILIEVDPYELTQTGEETRLVIRSAKGSREWIDAVLQHFVVGKPQKVPEALRLAL
jgi:hypothetical protein